MCTSTSPHVHKYSLHGTRVLHCWTGCPRQAGAPSGGALWAEPLAEPLAVFLAADSVRGKMLGGRLHGELQNGWFSIGILQAPPTTFEIVSGLGSPGSQILWASYGIG